ncbi:MAG: thiamine biosynthesis protein ThiS [Chloroflexi bacterium]|nr:thiamine biosynthesis protein ThiS [Chloroflexota bacterium]|tara:strand:- start:284 stop:484 length:201 start_codon:yes stop_codon:yes gene_type:complete
MIIKLNGKNQSFNDDISVSELLDDIKLSLSSIAIAINGNIIPKNEYKKTKLKDMDTVEIVRPVGGG